MDDGNPRAIDTCDCQSGIAGELESCFRMAGGELACAHAMETSPFDDRCYEQCPEGYADDGLTCRDGLHIFWKGAYDRGAGSVPTQCSGGRQYDTGLCYEPCAAPFDVSAGPVCWGHCPAWTVLEQWQERGAICAIDTSVLIQ